MTFSARLTRLTALVAPMLVLLPGGLVHAAPRAAKRAASLTGITVSFKLDPRLADSTHGGKLWSSPTTYFGAYAQDKVEARAEGVDARGAPKEISPRWIPSDPAMVTVSPAQGNQVTITVKRAGQSKLKVVAQGVSQECVVKASYQGNFIRVAITQLRVAKPATPTPAQKAPAAKNPLTEKKDDGTVTLPSGIRYKILKASDGPKPTDDDVVECRYRISAAHGKQLDGSDESKTKTFTVAQAGWKEALKLMPVGSKWEIFVPGQKIPRDRPRGRKRSGYRFSMPYVLEVELLAIKGPTTARAASATGPIEP